VEVESAAPSLGDEDRLALSLEPEQPAIRTTASTIANRNGVVIATSNVQTGRPVEETAGSSPAMFEPAEKPHAYHGARSRGAGIEESSQS
jgi:hypothetical protein